MSSFDKQTFLVVDDEEFSRSMVSRMLKRAGAREVITVEDGHQAIDVLNRHDISVMITDFHMPGIHGLQLLKNIRTGRTLAPRNLICAMLTGHAVRHLVGLAIVLDVDSFLAKPVSPETLTKHLNRAFQYRFDPLPMENYERVDVAHADTFLTGRPPPEAPYELSMDDAVTEPLPPDEEPAPVPEKPAEKTPPAAKAPAPEKPAAKPAAPVREVKPAPSRPKPSERTPVREIPVAAAGKGGKKEGVRVALSDVPEGAVLARNIIGASGTLLLAAGTPFRSRYVRRLQELKDMEGEIEHVWVYLP